MSQPGLQEFLAALPPEELYTVEESVPRDGVFTSLVLALEKRRRYPVVQFLHMGDSATRVVGNLFATRERIARMAGATTDNFYLKWHDAQQHPIPPVTVANGPVQDVVETGAQVDVSKLPIGVHFASDAGRYISSGIVVAKDPDTGVYNLSYHRMQLQAPNQFGISLHSRGHLWDYFRRAQLKGQDLEVAVVIGCHPAIYLAASSKIGIGEDEYALAGALLGEGVEMVRCNTVDLLVPASAEMVLEGRIKADCFEDEGPFGEYTGYSTSRSTRNVMEVTCVMRRENALFMDLVPGFSCEHLLLGGAAKEAEILYIMKDRFPTVEDVYFPKSGTHFHAYIKMKKTAEGQPRQAMALLTGLDMYLKTIIAVDDDIDIHDDENVLWALATRMQPDERIMVLPKLMCNVLDPSSHDGLSSKLLIDATLPLGQESIQCRQDAAVLAQAQAIAEKF